jgi:hypothetical protein
MSDRSLLENADQSLYECLRRVRRRIEKLPEQTSLQRLNKLAADLEFLTIALIIDELEVFRHSTLEQSGGDTAPGNPMPGASSVVPKSSEGSRAGKKASGSSKAIE